MNEQNEIDDVWRRNEPDSPCVKVCIIQPETGYCMGCYRTGAEIAAWTSMDTEARLALKAELPEREEFVIPKRRRGRRR